MRIPRLAALPLLVVVCAFGADTALDRYVKKPDPTYRYDLVSSTPGEGYTTYVIDLTSQTWRQPSEVDRTVWKHWLTIVKPDGVTSRHGLPFHYRRVDQGQGARQRPTQSYIENALTTHSVVAELQDVPNEPASVCRRIARPATKTASSPTPG